MTAIWDSSVIAKMSDEGKLRNLVRQLEQEARQWNRTFNYAGHKTSHGAGYIKNPQVRLICWGKGFKAKAQVQVNGNPTHKALSIANDAEQIYLELGAALDANQEGN